MVTESPRYTALRTIPTWPGQTSPAARRQAAANATGLRGNSLSADHAARHWARAREQTAQTAAAQTNGAPIAQRPGLLELAFVSAIAGHLSTCERCWTTGRETDRPVDWLSWAVLRKPTLAEILRPVLTAQSNRRLRTAPPGPHRSPEPAAAGR